MSDSRIRVSEPVALAGVAILYMFFAMWATRPSSSCAMVPEPHQQLNLERDVDREHLDRDVIEIERVARRYAAGLAGSGHGHNPIVSTPADEANADRCRDELDRGLMATHNMTLDQIRGAVVAER